MSKNVFAISNSRESSGVLTTMKEEAHEKSAMHEDLIAGDKI